MLGKYRICSITACLVIGLISEQADAQTNTNNPEAEVTELDKVIVTASPLQSNALEMTQSATVLSGEELHRRQAATIGDAVNEIPGVQNASFGSGVGRPVIRGLDGARVDVLENNVSSNDVSNVSADHAVSIEPFLAEQIEVIRGPATLIYGSDTIGGVVNVRTNRIPAQPENGIRGGVQLQADSVADETSAVVKLDGGNGTWAFHIDAFYRDTDDYDIPGAAELEQDHDDEHEEEHDEEHEEDTGSLLNSAVDTRGGAAGFSYFGDTWHAGLSISQYGTDYGIPGHGHEEEEHHEGEEEGEEEEEELVTIELDQTRYDFELGADNPWPWSEKVKLLISNNDYEHVELEGSEIGTQFFSDTLESRLEITHRPWGILHGVIGVQYSDREFSAIGEEAFVPASDTQTQAVFILEEVIQGDWRYEFGGRWEHQEIDTVDGRSVSHTPLSLSAGLVRHLSEETHLAANMTRAERAPAEEELFAFGPHIATQTFEIGDPNLTEERSTNYEVSLKKHGQRFKGSITYFYNDFSDYTALIDQDRIEDGLPVRQWQQTDATFKGFELEGSYQLAETNNGRWEINAFADRVTAEFDDNSNVPRTPPSRIGLGLDWNHNNWHASTDWIHYSDQNDVAAFETPTDGYDMVNLDASYFFNTSGRLSWEIYLKARNILNEEARNHTSLIKDLAPLAGRNWVIGLRALF